MIGRADRTERKIMNKEKSFIVDKALGFLAISESEGTKRGTASNGHVKSDVHAHYKGPKVQKEKEQKSKTQNSPPFAHC
jgi:hypothetical protein